MAEQEKELPPSLGGPTREHPQPCKEEQACPELHASHGNSS